MYRAAEHFFTGEEPKGSVDYHNRVQSDTIVESKPRSQHQQKTSILRSSVDTPQLLIRKHEIAGTSHFPEKKEKNHPNNQASLCRNVMLETWEY